MARYMRLDVCTNYILYIQNALSSPMDVLSRASEENLLDSGNSIYLRSQLTIERQQRKISEQENQIRSLEMDVVMWRTRFTNTQ